MNRHRLSFQTEASLLTLVAIAATVYFCSIGCKKSPGDPYVSGILAHRAEVDSFFRFHPQSPFNLDTSIRYEGIKWFPPDEQYCFKSVLYPYEPRDTVIVLGTKGEERTQIKYGYFIIGFAGMKYQLNVYTGPSPPDSGEERFFSLWFTDQTTGKETYPVGRYLDVGDENSDPEFIYTIDFNNAYNPYCAYCSLYSCAIPRKEDHLRFPILAGEMKYHK